MSNFTDFSTHGYQIERELGHNCLGGRVTYLATRINTQQSVVIKQFQFARVGANWSEYDAYEQEIKVLRCLNHPRIPRYLDSFEMPTGFCLVQDYKKASSLAQPRYFTPQEIKQIALAALEVLVYLQQQHPPVIHRDIKPENILVDRSQQLKVYLVDFGFARMGGGEVAASSAIKGTLGFMPPEQLFNRQLTEASDLYSLGATLICLLTKTKSTEVGNLIDEAYRINFKALVPTLNPQFVKWLEKMVAPSLKNRFNNAATALESLKAIDVVDNSTDRSRLVPVFGLATLSILALLSTTLITFRGEKTVGVKPSPTLELPSPIKTPRRVEPVSPFKTSGKWHFTFYRRDGKNVSVSLDTRNLTYSFLNFPGILPAPMKGNYSVENKVSDFFVVNFDVGTSLQVAKQAGFWRLYANPNASGEVILVGEGWFACHEVTSRCVRYTARHKSYTSTNKSNIKRPRLKKTPQRIATFQKKVRRLLLTRRCSGCDLRNARLGGANLWSAGLINANLEGADLRSANLWAANLEGANLKSVTLLEASLLGANLKNANLSGANLRNANMKSINLRNATLKGADLANANLENAYLEGTDFRGANLKGVNLTNARLKGAIMPDGTRKN